MLAFTLTVLLLIATPGPGVLSVAGVGSAYGARAGVLYIAGLCIGNSTVGLAVVTGLAAILLADERVRIIFLVLSLSYLTYLAWKIAFAGGKVAFKNPPKPPSFWDGLALQAINPKCYAVNTTIFAGFAFMPDSLLTETIIKFAIMNAIWIPVHFAWLYLGITIRKLDLPERVQSWINKSMAVSMLLVVFIATFA